MLGTVVSIVVGGGAVDVVVESVVDGGGAIVVDVLLGGASNDVVVVAGLWATGVDVGGNPAPAHAPVTSARIATMTTTRRPTIGSFPP